VTEILWVTAAVIAVALIVGAVMTKHPLRAFGSSMLQGICALAAVNVAAVWSGVSLGVTTFSTAVSAALGIPGVIGMLLLQTLCFAPL